jgi:hypothetical protein
METTLLESLLKDVGEGKRADSGFRKQTWEKFLLGKDVFRSRVRLLRARRETDCLA